MGEIEWHGLMLSQYAILLFMTIMTSNAFLLKGYKRIILNLSIIFIYLGYISNFADKLSLDEIPLASMSFIMVGSFALIELYNFLMNEV